MGFVSSKGIARLASDAIELEFESRDTTAGVILSGLEELRIPLGSVDSVRLKKSMLKTELFIKLRSMRPLREIPGHREGEVILRIARSRPAREKHRDIASEMHSQLKLKISELRIDRLDEEMKDLEA